MSKLLTAITCISLIGVFQLSSTSFAAVPPDKTVRVFYILPTDVPLDSTYPKNIAKVMRSAQRYFLEQCKFTFKLNDPVCEVINGTHPRSWYENTANPSGSTDNYWYAVFNGMDDLKEIVPALAADGNRSKWKIVEYIDAEGTGAGGGGGNGEVLLPKHDADGAKIYPEDSARWVGGMVHELGHCFGLDDASSTDGTVMSASFYGWPNCIFNSGHISDMKNLAANSGFWATSITDTKKDFIVTQNRTVVSLAYQNKCLIVKLENQDVKSIDIELFNITGKCIVKTANVMKSSKTEFILGGLKNLPVGTYLCKINEPFKTSYHTLIIR